MQIKAGAASEVTVEVGRWDGEASTFEALTGTANRRANAVRVLVRRNGIPSFFAAILGRDSFSLSREAIAATEVFGCKIWARKKIKVKGGGLTDSYNGCGSYDAGSAGDQGHVCSCDDLEVDGDSLVNGDARLVDTGKFNGSSGSVTGDVTKLSDCYDPMYIFGGVTLDNDAIGLTANGEDPMVDLEEWVEEEVDAAIDDWDYSWDLDPDADIIFEDAKIKGDGKKFKLKVEKNDSLTLPEGDYYFEKLELKEGATLHITGPTRIHIGKDVKIEKNSALIPDSNDPLDVMVIHNGKKFDLKEDSLFYGYVLGPNTKIKIHKSSEFFGAAVAKEVEIKDGGAFHADDNLRLPGVNNPKIDLVR
jgi:hypothetical protein